VLVDGVDETYDGVRSVGEIGDWRECIQVNGVHLIAVLSSTTAAAAVRIIITIVINII